MSANFREHPRIKEICDMLQTEEGAKQLFEQSWQISQIQSRESLEKSLFDNVVDNSKKHGTLGYLIDQLKLVANVVGEDVEVFIRNEEGIQVPHVCIENTPNELPVDKIVTLKGL